MPSDTVQIIADFDVHKLVVSRAHFDDAAEYTVVAGDQTSQAKLAIEGREATVDVVPGEVTCIVHTCYVEVVPLYLAIIRSTVVWNVALNKASDGWQQLCTFNISLQKVINK